jgi:hypothetical protein
MPNFWALYYYIYITTLTLEKTQKLLGFTREDVMCMLSQLKCTILHDHIASDSTSTSCYYTV